MVSILENPELLEGKEDLIPMSTAGKHVPPKGVNRSTVERWTRIGVKGIKLETVRVGGRRYTTLGSIQKFLIAQQKTGEQGEPTTPKPSMTKAEIEAGRKRFGLPEPQEPSLN